ncbi:MAG: hypothetical protein JO122_07465 [Acetobacteraceae bacterium]|nr:hypothetical protein [Acetobacteraceae bacterium]
MVWVSPGDLWLNTIDGIERIPREELDHLRGNPAYAVQSIIFDYLDGAGRANQIRPLPSAIETADGRLWFVAPTGVVSIDSTHLIRNMLAPPVTIWSLSAGRKRFTELVGEIQLPANAGDLQIQYSAGSLTVPERVRFRYKLDGSDHDWQEVGTRRQAFYTHLGPGHYTFRVIASNNDGVWNSEGASLAFTIPPAFYQTGWFYALCAIAGLLVLIQLYRVRVRQVAAQISSRMEVRLAERERIARELHDTLLQSFQALLLRFQTATRLLATRPGEARQVLESTMDQAEQALADGRNAVQGLRSWAVDSHDLVEAIKTFGEQLAADPGHDRSTPMSLRVEGTPRKLEPMVRDEIYRIAGEALRNAFRHSGAARIEVELRFDEGQFELRVRDDGKGIDSKFLSEERRGKHFGLSGMRERAEMIGGKLTLWTSPNSGTELELKIPGSRAYRASERRRPSLLERLSTIGAERES